VSLFDGSFHVIQNLSHEPMWSSSTADGRDGAEVGDSNATFTSEGLSAASRTAFTLAERRDIRFTDVNRISGMLAHDDASGVMMWLHEYVVIHLIPC
jgi:general transcription factor 3C protein 4